jgi:hypothetical protein
LSLDNGISPPLVASHGSAMLLRLVWPRPILVALLRQNRSWLLDQSLHLCEHLLLQNIALVMPKYLKLNLKRFELLPKLLLGHKMLVSLVHRYLCCQRSSRLTILQAIQRVLQLLNSGALLVVILALLFNNFPNFFLQHFVCLLKLTRRNL